MEYALDSSGSRLTAAPTGRALCPSCREPVIAKCGEINVWHWAHEAGSDCDPWSEPESEWHRYWKSLAERTEVVMPPHRADILTDQGVVELQHGSLSPAEVAERELFYGRMTWLVDLRECRDRMSLGPAKKPGEEWLFPGQLELRPSPEVWDAMWEDRTERFWWIEWYWRRKWVAYCTRPMFWDIRDPDWIFRVKHIGRGRFVKGVFVRREEYIERIIQGAVPE